MSALAGLCLGPECPGTVNIDGRDYVCLICIREGRVRRGEAESDPCPHCHTDLQRGEFSRKIGVTIPGVYDGTLFWQCPACGGRWHRFPDGHPLNERAERFVVSTP